MAKFDVAALERIVRRGLSQTQINKLSKQYPGAVTQKSKDEIRRALDRALLELQLSLITATGELFGVSSGSGNASYAGWVTKVEDDEDGMPIGYVTYKGDLHRASLNPDNDGVDNILALLEQGFTVKSRTPYGKWHDKWIRGTAYRPANPQIKTAIEKFNKKYAGSFTADVSNTEFSYLAD